MLEKFYSLFWNEIEYLQTERHACLGDQLLEGFCKEKNINIVAYSPFWHGHLLKDERLKVLASGNWISVSQMLLAYLLNKGFFVIPKSSNFQRLQENIEAWRVVLSENTVQSIECLEKHFRYNNPPFAPRYE
jgi:2,5-diketo-D-gluconate reductase B